jgi:DNA invertase Pin-like site-specific DNA recombinase
MHILAAVAQNEREMIAQRTKEAMAAAKARGVKFGNPNLAAVRAAGSAANREAAERFAANVLPIIREIQASGVGSLCGVARALSERGFPTARGGAWTARSVANVIARKL